MRVLPPPRSIHPGWTRKEAVDNTTRQKFLAYFFGADDTSCVGCEAGWLANERVHADDCSYLKWERDEEAAGEVDYSWCWTCEAYTEDVYDAEGWMSRDCGHPVFANRTI